MFTINTDENKTTNHTFFLRTKKQQAISSNKESTAAERYIMEWLPLLLPTPEHPARLKAVKSRTNMLAKNFFITLSSTFKRDFLKKHPQPIPLVWGQEVEKPL